MQSEYSYDGAWPECLIQYQSPPAFALQVPSILHCVDWN